MNSFTGEPCFRIAIEADSAPIKTTRGYCVGVTASEIAAVVQEVGPALTGGWIQKISQPAPRTITLEIRCPGQTHQLLLAADPETARLHMTTQRQAGPPTPPSFCRFLRARIQGARVELVEQVQGDRIVRLRLAAKDGAFSLIVSLTGRSADLLLLDGEEHILMSLIHGQDQVGQPYRPTPPRAWTGASPTEDQPRTIKTPLDADRTSPFPVSLAIEQRYQEREMALAQDRLRQTRLAEVRKQLKKLTRRMEGLRQDLEKAAAYREYLRYGELLKASLAGIRKGHEQLTVVDYFDPNTPELVIPLNPAKGPRANMEDFFRKHRKHVTAEKEIRPRLEANEQEAARLRAELAAIQEGTWTPPPSVAPGLRPPRKSRTAQAPGVKARSGPFRRFTSSDGLAIYVGRNARENEELTFKMAHSDDLWLHARGTPGSHVVVRVEKGSSPPPETVRDAANLALLYSDLKRSGKGEVIYTRRKWVRKATGQSTGTVTVTQEKSIFVQLDRARLQRLKESST